MEKEQNQKVEEKHWETPEEFEKEIMKLTEDDDVTGVEVPSHQDT